MCSPDYFFEVQDNLPDILDINPHEQNSPAHLWPVHASKCRAFGTGREGGPAASGVDHGL